MCIALVPKASPSSSLLLQLVSLLSWNLVKNTSHIIFAYPSFLLTLCNLLIRANILLWMLTYIYIIPFLPSLTDDRDWSVTAPKILQMLLTLLTVAIPKLGSLTPEWIFIPQGGWWTNSMTECRLRNTVENGRLLFQVILIFFREPFFPSALLILSQLSQST